MRALLSDVPRAAASEAGVALDVPERPLASTSRSNLSPIVIGVAVDLFVDDLVAGAASICDQRGGKALGSSHLKSYVQSQSNLDFIHHLFQDVPDLAPETKKASIALASPPRQAASRAWRRPISSLQKRARKSAAKGEGKTAKKRRKAMISSEEEEEEQEQELASGGEQDEEEERGAGPEGDDAPAAEAVRGGEEEGGWERDEGNGDGEGEGAGEEGRARESLGAEEAGGAWNEEAGGAEPVEWEGGRAEGEGSEGAAGAGAWDGSDSEGASSRGASDTSSGEVSGDDSDEGSDEDTG